MKLLMNPTVLTMAGAFLICMVALFAGALLMRHMRRKIGEESDLASTPTASGGEFQVAAFHGVIQRLKEQERELQALREAERRQASKSENISEAVLSNLSSGVLLFDPSGLVRQANAAARTILGFASMFGLHARDVFRGIAAVRADAGDDPAPSLSEAVERTLRSGQTFRRLEADYRAPGGEKRVLGVTLSAVRSQSGETLGAACLISDLTEITDLSRQIQMKENLAALGEMSAGIAHEFKNSLATISGYAQMLASDNDAATVREFAGKIAGETATLTRIVTDFLNFARPHELDRQPIELRPMLEDGARECGVTLQASLPEGCAIIGDRTALRQALSNLLRNSAEAARNGVPVEVAASADVTPAGTRLVLKDNGAGIPPENLSRIFIPFFTTKAKGTGLGLAMVHRIVTEHGGSISVGSDPAGGTTFTLLFPAEKRGKSASTPVKMLLQQQHRDML